MNRALPFLILLLGFFKISIVYGQPQRIDSLKNILKSYPKEDSLKVKLLNELAYSYYQVSLAKMRTNAQRAQKLAHKIDDCAQEALAFAYIAIAWANEGKHHNALNSINQGIKIGKNCTPQSLRAPYNILGIIHKMKGNYPEALRAYKKAAEVIIASKDELHLAMVYSNMAFIYQQQQDHQEVIKTLLKSAKIVKKFKKEEMLGVIYNNLGNTYEALADSNKAFSYYQKALNINQRFGLKGEMSQNYYNLGSFYWHQGKVLLAKQYFERALNIVKQIKSRRDLPPLLNMLAQVAIQEKKLLKAQQYLQKAENILLKTQNPQHRIRILQTQAKLDSTQGNYQAAIAQLQRSYQIGDSIRKIEKSQQLSNLQESLKLWKKENENEKLRQLQSRQNETLEWQNYLLLSISLGAFLLLLAVFFLVYFYRNKQKNNQKLRNLNQQVSEQKNLLSNQAQELAEAQEKLLSQNQALEDTVNERTLQLKMQKQQLMDYAFFNAHKVRGPLANLMGLVYLIQHKIEPEQTSHYIDLLAKSAKVLDERIREINQLFDEDE